jgi:hypothetical protein
MLESLRDLIPPSVIDKSGSVFYSGRAAFSAPSSVYVLGLNPGGNPNQPGGETVRAQTSKVLSKTWPEYWSAYRDESWENAPPGTWRLQPRVLHLMNGLDLDPGLVPSSNLVFVRSARATGVQGNIAGLVAETWPFHQAVIEALGVRVILCFGKLAGHWTAKMLGANQLVGELVETNKRRWRSLAFENSAGTVVVRATHPSIADWTSPSCDPTPLVKFALIRTRV